MVFRSSAPSLSTPRRGIQLGVHYDNDAFGRFSESIARFIGTARFLVAQSFVCVGWVAWNILAPVAWQFDSNKRGLVLLTLVLSLQAAYAAPLILLAQNRQAERDRLSGERDRANLTRTLDETAFLARELASIRVALSDVTTSDDLDHLVDRLENMLHVEDPQLTDGESGDERRRFLIGRRLVDRDRDRD